MTTQPISKMRTIFKRDGIRDPLVRIGKVQNSLFKKDTLSEAQLNHHVHVVGASGFGKTVFLSSIIKQQIESGKGLFFIDLKNDLETIYRFSQMAKAAGREDDFLIFSLTDRKFSSSYNLIKHGTATQVRDRIMQSLTWSEEYYKNVAGSFLLKVLIGLVHLRDEKWQPLHLGSVHRAVSEIGFLHETNKSLIDAPQNIKDPFREALQWVTGKDTDNWNSLQGLRSQLESIVRSDFGELVTSDKENGIDLFDAVQNGKLVFLFLDSRRYGESAKAIGRFILQDLKATSARIDAEVEKNHRKPFSVIIDEFADLAQEDFIGFLDRARSSKMSIVVAHQEISDLRRISPEFANRLTGNTSTLYAFLQKNPDSAEFISGIAGTHQVKRKTERYSRGLFLSLPTGETSVRDVEEFIVHPNVVKKLRVGECVVVKKYPRSSAYVVRVNANG